MNPLTPAPTPVVANAPRRIPISDPTWLLARIIFQAWQSEEASSKFIHDDVYKWRDQATSQWAANFNFHAWTATTPKSVICDLEAIDEFYVTYPDPCDLTRSITRIQKFSDIFVALAKHPLKLRGPCDIDRAYGFAQLLLNNENRILREVKKDCLALVKNCPHFWARPCATTVFVNLFATEMDVWNVRHDAGSTPMPPFAIRTWMDVNYDWMIGVMNQDPICVLLPDAVVPIGTLGMRIQNLLAG